MQPSKQERRGGWPRGVIPAQSGGHRARRCIFSLAAVLLMAGFTAASADDADLCANQKFPPEIRIPACSHVIAWGQSNDARLAPSYRSRADAWLLSNDPDKALADFDAAIALDKKSAAAYLGRAVAWYRKSQYDNAIPDFDHAIELNPLNSTGYHGRGNAWFRKGNLDRALADLNEAVRLAPTLGALGDRGNVNEKMQSIDLARSDYEAVLKLVPKDGVEEQLQAVVRARLAKLGTPPPTAGLKP
jgi:tetratricopeptide (TPR) repeat protein